MHDYWISGNYNEMARILIIGSLDLWRFCCSLLRDTSIVVPFSCNYCPFTPIELSDTVTQCWKLGKILTGQRRSEPYFGSFFWPILIGFLLFFGNF